MCDGICSAKEQEIAKLMASAEADKKAAVQQEKEDAHKQIQELKEQLEEVRRLHGPIMHCDCRLPFATACCCSAVFRICAYDGLVVRTVVLLN